MPEPEQKKNYLEVFDVSDKSVVGTVPLDHVKHMPRAGERIFLPVDRPDGWIAYKIVDIEYFLRTTERPLEEQFTEPGMFRVTVYVERSK
jgi:hypothetical protein